MSTCENKTWHMKSSEMFLLLAFVAHVDKNFHILKRLQPEKTAV